MLAKSSTLLCCFPILQIPSSNPENLIHFSLPSRKLQWPGLDHDAAVRDLGGQRDLRIRITYF